MRTLLRICMQTRPLAIGLRPLLIRDLIEAARTRLPAGGAAPHCGLRGARAARCGLQSELTHELAELPEACLGCRYISAPWIILNFKMNESDCCKMMGLQ